MEGRLPGVDETAHHAHAAIGGVHRCAKRASKLAPVLRTRAKGHL